MRLLPGRSAFARVKKLSAALASPKTKDAVPASANASASDGLNEILRIAERSSTAPAGSDITGGTLGVCLSKASSALSSTACAKALVDIISAPNSPALRKIVTCMRLYWSSRCPTQSALTVCSDKRLSKEDELTLRWMRNLSVVLPIKEPRDINAASVIISLVLVIGARKTARQIGHPLKQCSACWNARSNAFRRRRHINWGCGR